MNKVLAYTALISNLIIGNFICINTQASQPKQEEKTTKQLEHELSDYRITGKKIKDRFEKWIEKDEFEKTINHETRLQKESLQMFSSICMDEIQKQGGYFEIELQKYDADKEHFSVAIQKKLGQTKEGYEWVDRWKTVVHSLLKIPIEEAKQLKSYYDNGRIRTLGTDLTLVDNNFLATNYLLQTPNRQYQLNNPVINAQPIIYSTKSLNINNERLPFIEFNYKDYIKEQSGKTSVNTNVSMLPESESDNVIFTNVEVLPEYPGGIGAFYKWLGENLIYPPISRKNNIQGRVTVNFVVEKDGSLTDIKVLRGVAGGADLDAEAIRVLKESTKWKPGVQNGRPVRVSYSVPVMFQPPQ